MTGIERASEQGVMLRNRVLKNFRHHRKWAQRENISCFRVYDRDIPEIPFAIDYYDGRLYVAQFVKKEEENVLVKEGEWGRQLLFPLAAALEVSWDDVFVKTRRRQTGANQYSAKGTESNRFVVQEGDFRFYVNLVDYLDTGLFLDHRKTRAMVAAEAKEKRMLNLFCYTGSFQVYAAGAGAGETIGVDLSNTYTQWAQENLKLNGLLHPKHELITGDTLTEVGRLKQKGKLFDLVVVDPPTFSNSKKMEGTWDVQRDHGDLLHRVHEILAPAGVVYFSTNHRRFKLTPDIGQLFQLEEITYKTIPPDFRNKKIHRCWRMSRK